MRALVTGATGCVGANIVEALLSRGYDVRAMRRHTSRLDALVGLQPEMVVGDVIGPFQRKLAELIRPFMAREMEREALLLHIQSIIAMVIHFNFARNPVMRITGRQYDDRFKDELVDHVVQFSLSGLNGAGEGGVP